MSAFRDRTGERYGRLLVVARVANRGARVVWRCVCDCGAETDVIGTTLGASTVSCGCLGTERRRTKGQNVKHGFSRTRTYRIWTGMRKRCENPAAHAFDRYGGRGIKVCARWHSFEAFLADMGEAPEGMGIEREDNDGHYEPANCCWASDVEQANNKRNNRMVDGLTVAQYARANSLTYATAYRRSVLLGGAPRRSEQGT